MDHRILVASPVQQNPEILHCFLETLKSLKKENLEIDFMFFDDNIVPESTELIKEFQKKYPQTEIVSCVNPLSYRKDEITHYWDNELVDRVADFKDQMIEYAVKFDYDKLLLVDSDVLMHPDTLINLHNTDKEIVSSIFWTKWSPDAIELPQVWMMDEYSMVRSPRYSKLSKEEKTILAQAFIEQLRVPGLYEVGGLGACTLMKRSALLKGVRFKRLPNLSFWGEDRHFCVRAAALGIQLYVDTRTPAFHYYRESDREEAYTFMRQYCGLQEAQKEISISLCMIVKDEENVLERCLSSVARAVDEIIIVDTGSNDRTKEIASKFGASVLDFEWIDDFAAARNFSFSKATQDYIMWLDADDILEEQECLKLLKLKQHFPAEVDTVMMDYHLSVQENGAPLVSLKRNRLVRRTLGFQWIGAVHEYLEVSGNQLISDIAVIHKKEKAYSDRNLRIYRSRLQKGEEFSARDIYYFANELRDHAYYQEAAEQYEQFIETGLGWIEDQLAACMKLADCYGKLKERDRQLNSLVRTMTFGKPRAECCCRLGTLFMEEGRYPEAIFWYETATRLGKPPGNGAIIENAAWSWLPYLQLCVCYDKMGDIQMANKCNEKALELYPDHPSMLYNKKYLQLRLEMIEHHTI